MDEDIYAKGSGTLDGAILVNLSVNLTKKLAQLRLTVFNSSVEHLKEAVVAVAKELTKFTDVNGEDGHGHGHGQAVKVSDVHLSISAAPLQGHHHKVFLSKCKS